MGTLKKWGTPILVAAVVVVGGAWASTWHLPDVKMDAAAAEAPGDPVHGAYLAKAGDCIACHTVQGGKPFDGGLAFELPFGTIYSSNISPDPEHGIGNYTFPDFVRVMRDGVTKDGRRLYPAMPYTAYAKVSDADLKDLYTYFMKDVPASATPNRPSTVIWPLSIRWPLAFWNRAFHDDHPFQPDASQSAEWNRGAYLVQGLEHCGTCHTPRGVAMQELDLTGKTSQYLSGTVLEHSSPINLRGDIGSGLGAWTTADIVALLATGRNDHSAVSGPMTEVVTHSTQYLTQSDLQAIAVYLKSLPAKAASTDTPSYQASDATFQSIMSGGATAPGAATYINSCSACHRQNGKGAAGVFPSLAGNPMVLAAHPDSLIAIVLNGSRLPSTAGAPSGLAMPPYGWRYSDEEVAQLTTFVRSAWGNQAPAVTADQVAAVRKQLQQVKNVAPK